MKLSTATILTLIAALFLGCTSDPQSSSSSSQQGVSNTPAPANAPATTTAAASLQHYICPNNCANSGGPAAGSCPVCGTSYVHNQAYHNQPGNATTTAPGQNPLFQQGQQPAQSTTVNPTIQTQPQRQPSPAQNAAGIYHYTCQSGCSGGSGTAGTCGQCGGTLVHNQAYHQ